MARPDASETAAPPPRKTRGGARWTDDEVERRLSQLLRAGVMISATIILVGGALYLSRHGNELPHYGSFVGEPEDLRTLSGILHAAAALSGRGLIQLGVLLLIATPVARVFFSLMVFLLEGDRTYAVITAFVLGLLLVSLSGVIARPDNGQRISATRPVANSQ